MTRHKDYTLVESLLTEAKIPFTCPTEGHYNLSLEGNDRIVYYPKSHKAHVLIVGSKDKVKTLPGANSITSLKHSYLADIKHLLDLKLQYAENGYIS